MARSPDPIRFQPLSAMAAHDDVRRYLAYWFQLGKKVWIRNGQASLLPESVIQGDRYSDEFEACWRCILSEESGDCYLDGTHQTVQQLLSDGWDIVACARCQMPVPMAALGRTPITDSLGCPCSDLPLWPNTELPAPRHPVNSQTQLQGIRDRLSQPRSD
jgi:hypothetical protein